MQVVFTKDVKNVARKGEVKAVKDGYFRNFLLPRGIAVMATKSSMHEAEELMKKVVIEKERIAEDAKEIKAKLKGLKLSLTSKAKGETLYGSITEKEIINAIEEQIKVRLEKKHVVIKEAIKTVGSHEVNIKLADGVETKVTVEVAGEK